MSSTGRLTASSPSGAPSCPSEASRLPAARAALATQQCPRGEAGVQSPPQPVRTPLSHATPRTAARQLATTRRRTCDTRRCQARGQTARGGHGSPSAGYSAAACLRHALSAAAPTASMPLREASPQEMAARQVETPGTKLAQKKIWQMQDFDGQEVISTPAAHATFGEWLCLANSPPRQWPFRVTP
jgi:hypothetical protein